MKNKLLLIITVFTLWCLSLKAQNFNHAWAALFQHKIDSVNHGTGGDTVGVTAAFYMPGQGLWTGTDGFTNPGVPMNTGIKVEIGSNSKLFLGTVMLKLQEQHVLSLDDHISKWVHTALNNVDTSATIRQLLNHESGTADSYRDTDPSNFLYDLFADTSHFFTPQEMIDKLPAPYFAKGHGFHYSNVTYSLCTMIIQAATGKPYWQNLHEQILAPLHMDSTDVWLYDQVKQNYSGGYATTINYPGPFTSFISLGTGAGDIHSTPQEMVQWYAKLFGGQVLADSSLKQLLDIEPASNFGAGITNFHADTLGHDTYFYEGGWGTFQSFAVYDRTSKACFFVATNYVDEYNQGIAYPFLLSMFQAYRDGLPKRKNDAGVTLLVSPAGTAFGASFSPVITLRNFGTAALKNVYIHYKLDKGTTAIYKWKGNLATDRTINVTLPGITAANGRHDIMAYTAMPNGAAEGYTFNDTMRYSFVTSISAAYNGHFHEGFEGDTMALFSWNAENFSIFNLAPTKLLAGHSGNHSLVAGSYNSKATGHIAYADLPVIHLNTGAKPSISFSYSYAPYPGYADSVQLLVSADGGSTWQSLFYKGGPDLATADAITEMFAPQTAKQWKTEKISLAAYSGNILFRFRHYNEWANNLYIDDIDINSDPVTIIDTLIARNEGRRNRIDWNTLDEKKGDWFILEKSYLGSPFIAITNKIYTHGKPSTYNAYDALALQGKNSYRIKIFDKTDNVILSDTVTVNVGSNDTCALTVYPNPVHDILNIRLSCAPTTKFGGVVSLINQNGNVVMIRYMSGTETKLNFSRFPNGIYYVEYNDGFRSERRKVVKL